MISSFHIAFCYQTHKVSTNTVGKDSSSSSIEIMMTACAAVFICVVALSGSIATGSSELHTDEHEMILKGRALLQSPAPAPQPAGNCTFFNRTICLNPILNPAGGIDCCAGKCVNLATDNNNCLLCGNKCPTGTTCCSSFCLNLQNNSFNCGRCGLVCPFRIIPFLPLFPGRCENGVCV
ncbi:hypothetical protein MPTK1_5g09850 [Marchantia polymorpha subsp. ruderalis]|uniref:Stigma-specific STIG1-like protein 1 n=2 Tax=Marchantia polymorpha TaxID=3197 RepID=A0AAF6BGQ8_MARPO|nr:hypothetical protein MARPO_0048s0086 [Marchantia polymorpha]BBN11192.1 hypothetical protein Mp_5g09850 [Marchantia polymorpha subsp. ruderalis]|eukprot:PTQ38977.1 hypothetical protein MARPO_0048s0086 [Marchantia polymorpha]